MADFKPVTLSEFGSKRWQRPVGMAHARQEVLVGLSLPELFKAVTCLPIALAPLGEFFRPVAVLGLEPGKNLFVAPDGRWLGEYVPASLRGYPFRLLPTQDGQQMLAFNLDSGLLVDADAPGEAFFAEDGSPVASLKELVQFLDQIDRGSKLAVQLCSLLKTHELIQPWPVKVQGPDGVARNVEGLFRVDEEALRRLPLEALGALRDAGALPLMYCQLLSMQHLSRLAQLSDAHAQAAAKAASAAQVPLTQDARELDLSFLSQDGAIKLGGLG